MATKPPPIATTRPPQGENDNRGEPPMTMVDGPPDAVVAYYEWWNGLTREERWCVYDEECRSAFATMERVALDRSLEGSEET